MNDKELSKELENWFNNNKNDLINNKNIWARDLIAKVLKNELKILSHWKNKSTGRKSNLKQLEIARKKRDEIKKQKELDKKLNINW